MKPAIAVIGANYGDEGKGRIVDYLANPNSAVIRFNGGAQAGHTVVDNDGRRHVFHHVGSGALRGARTYLAKHFVLNPILFWNEYPELCKLAGVIPLVAADPRCAVTTPYDMIINQWIEDHRGDERHGSTGVGFGETIERTQYPAFRLLKADLAHADNLRQKMINIRDHWLPSRFAVLKIPPPRNDDIHLSNKWVDAFIEAARKFERAVPSAGLEYVQAHDIIFEGAQGLLLDMDHGDFPHVTRSNTGLSNVVPIARTLALKLSVIYVTRTYLTRHGAGPIKNQFEPPIPIEDETNKPHPFQGTLRFGHLDPHGLGERIALDVAIGGRSVGNVCLAVNCCDQINLTKAEWPYPVKWRGYGPSRGTLKHL